MNLDSTFVQLGVAGAALLILYRLGRLAIEKIGAPFLNAHLENQKQLMETNTQLAGSVQDIQRTQIGLLHTVEEVHTSVREHVRICERAARDGRPLTVVEKEAAVPA